MAPLISFDGMRGSIHRNDVSSQGWHVLETSSTYPTKSVSLLLHLYVPTHIVGAYRGVSAIGGPATLGERHITRRCASHSLEPGIDQHSACMAQVLQRVGMHIHVRGVSCRGIAPDARAGAVPAHGCTHGGCSTPGLNRSR